MGNKLCGPKRATCRRHDSWPLKRNTHLLRLWAEIFRVRVDSEEYEWERVSEDVVPINVASSQNTRAQVFQITASNRQVQLIFDVLIHQPGTSLHQANECFVHWKDTVNNCEWGLNFTTPTDAQRFYECCMLQQQPRANTDSLPRRTNYNIQHQSLEHSRSLDLQDLTDTRNDNSYAYGSNIEGCTCGLIGHEQLDGVESVLVGKRQHFSTTRSKSADARVSEDNLMVSRELKDSEDSPLLSEVSSYSGRQGATATQMQYSTGALRHYISSDAFFVERNKSFHNNNSQSFRRNQLENLNLSSNAKSYPAHFLETCIDDMVDDKSSPLSKQSAADVSPDFQLDSVTLKRLLTSFPAVSPASSVEMEAAVVQLQDESQNVGLLASAAAKNIRQDSFPDSGYGFSMEGGRDNGGGGSVSLHRNYKHVRPTHFSKKCWRSCSNLPQQDQHLNAKCDTLVNEEATMTETFASCKNIDFIYRQIKELREKKRMIKNTERRINYDKDDDTDSENDEPASNISSSSSLTTVASDSHASIARQVGAIRKAGWLQAKNWLLHKKRKLEPASKRRWHKYWVCLKGTVLLFYKAATDEDLKEDQLPIHALIVEGSVAQSMPEHPKREHVFMIGTAFGDVYLMQACDEVELENWISSIHSACAAMFARQRGKSDTLKVLCNEVQRFNNSIDLDKKMKQLAELKVSVTEDLHGRQKASREVVHWEENLEKMYVEQYRYRCYMASLQNGDYPNPKSILAYVSKNTKMTLNKINMFNVMGLYALVCARTPLTSNTQRQRIKSRCLFGSNAEDKEVNRYPQLPSVVDPIASAMKQDSSSSSCGAANSPSNRHRDQMNENIHLNTSLNKKVSSSSSCVRNLAVILPHGQSYNIAIPKMITVQEIIDFACKLENLDPHSHFMYINHKKSGVDLILDSRKTFQTDQNCQLARICAKQLLHTYLARKNKDQQYGMTIDAEVRLVNRVGTDNLHELCVYVSKVNMDGAAEEAGVRVGDEILIINGYRVSEIDMAFVEDMFEKSKGVEMVVRTCRIQPPPVFQYSHEIGKDFSYNLRSKSFSNQLEVATNSDTLATTRPAEKETISKYAQQFQNSPKSLKNQLQKKAITNSCLKVHSLDDSHCSTQAQKLTPEEKIKQCVTELLDAERSYIKCLEVLLHAYIIPLRRQFFSQSVDVENICDITTDMLTFHYLFLKSLEEAVHVNINYVHTAQPDQLKKILVLLANCFLRSFKSFKIYSSFCVCHLNCLKWLNSDESKELRNFLMTRNSHNQQSFTLESCLIKPIHRILMYPTLLDELRGHCTPQSEEWIQLSEALKEMEFVAEHVHEMQKIDAEFGNLFEDLMRMFCEFYPNKPPLNLSIGELQMYGTVEWLNSSESIGKSRKNVDLYTVCFVFTMGIAVYCRERNRQKRKSWSVTTASPSLSEDLVRFKTIIPVLEIQIRSCDTSDANNIFLWDLIHLCRDNDQSLSKIYHFSNASYDARQDFLGTIRQCIRENVHNDVQTTKTKAATNAKQNNLYLTGPRVTASTSNNSSPAILPARRLKQAPPLPQRISSQLTTRSSYVRPDCIRLEQNEEARFEPSDVTKPRSKSGGADLKRQCALTVSSFSDSNSSSRQTTPPNIQPPLTLNVNTQRSARLIYSSHDPLQRKAHNLSHQDSASLAPKMKFLNVTRENIAENSISPVWKPRSKVTCTIKGSNVNESDQQMSASPAYGDYTAFNNNDNGGGCVGSGILSRATSRLSERNQKSVSISDNSISEDRTAL